MTKWSKNNATVQVRFGTTVAKKDRIGAIWARQKSILVGLHRQFRIPPLK